MKKIVFFHRLSNRFVNSGHGVKTEEVLFNIYGLKALIETVRHSKDSNRN